MMIKTARDLPEGYFPGNKWGPPTGVNGAKFASPNFNYKVEYHPEYTYSRYDAPGPSTVDIEVEKGWYSMGYQEYWITGRNERAALFLKKIYIEGLHIARHWNEHKVGEAFRDLAEELDFCFIEDCHGDC